MQDMSAGTHTLTPTHACTHTHTHTHRMHAHTHTHLHAHACTHTVTHRAHALFSHRIHAWVYCDNQIGRFQRSSPWQHASIHLGLVSLLLYHPYPEFSPGMFEGILGPNFTFALRAHLRNAVSTSGSRLRATDFWRVVSAYRIERIAYRLQQA